MSCPVDFAEELAGLARQAGIPDLVIRAREASLEESFLAMKKGAS
jgi:ABC-2 type transport system ATP-binding protein